MFIISLSPIASQEEEIVSIKTFISKDGVHPDGTFLIAYQLDIMLGWHINSPGREDDFLIPSELIVEESDDIKILKLYYPEPKSEKFDYSVDVIQIYENEVILGALVKVNPEIAIGEHIIKARLFYQPCNDQTCQLPQSQDIEIPFRVVPLYQKIKEINKDIFSKMKFKKNIS